MSFIASFTDLPSITWVAAAIACCLANDWREPSSGIFVCIALIAVPFTDLPSITCVAAADFKDFHLDNFAVDPCLLSFPGALFFCFKKADFACNAVVFIRRFFLEA